MRLSNSSKEDELLSFLSEKIAEKVQTPNSSVKPLLKRFVYSRAKQKIIALHPKWMDKGVLGPESLAHFTEKSVLIDLNYYSNSVMAEFLAAIECNIIRKEEKIVEVVAEKVVENKCYGEVDKKVGPGGQTVLMMAAGRGDYEEVVRLVEVEKARIDVVDNKGMTAAVRAQRLGHARVAQYLMQIRTIT